MEFTGIFIAACIIALYFLPTMVACNGHKKNKDAIMVLNLLTGWTFIGWLIALVWSFTKD